MSCKPFSVSFFFHRTLVSRPRFDDRTRVFASRKPDITSSKIHFPMRFATEEQAARGIWQNVNVMHINRHITSYEIFTEEKDGDVGDGKVEEGNVEEEEIAEEGRTIGMRRD